LTERGTADESAMVAPAKGDAPMVRSHLSTDSRTKVAYQILQGAKGPTTVQVPLLEITKKDLNVWGG
jgi:hypothetical protein